MADVLSIVASCIELLFDGDHVEECEELGYAPVSVSRAVLCVNKRAHVEFPKLLDISKALAEKRTLLTDRFISQCYVVLDVPEEEMLSNLKNDSLNFSYRVLDLVRRPNVFTVCVDENWIRCVDYILETRPHVAGRDELNYCISLGRLEMVRSFLVSDNHTVDLQMALNAAVCGSMDGGEIVKLLLSFGAVIDNDSPNTTLMIAVSNHLSYDRFSSVRRSNQVRNVLVLLDHGADISAKDAHGMNVICKALSQLGIEFEDTSVFGFNCSLIDALLSRCQTRDLDHTVSNFKYGNRTLEVATPLTIAICCGPLHVVEMVLRNGANPKLGIPTPLEVAYRYRYYDDTSSMVPLLLKPKYGVPREGIFEYISRHFIGGFLQPFVRWLRSEGVRITAENMVTALEFPDALSVFLVFGGNPDAVDSCGTPVLVLATERNFIESVRLLLKHGADRSVLSARQRRQVLRRLPSSHEHRWLLRD
jgi:ankyrin repeat protein